MEIEIPKGARVAAVRAIPHPPHKRRWCGLERWVADPERRPKQEMEELPQGGLRPLFDEKGQPIWAKHALPWPDTEVKVFVVDEPALFDPEKNGGVPTEISPSTLVMLQGDARISVHLVSGDGSEIDAEELIHAKAAAAKAEDKIVALQRDMAQAAERSSRVQSSQDARLKEQAAEIERLRGTVAERDALIASQSTRKGR